MAVFVAYQGIILCFVAYHATGWEGRPMPRKQLHDRGEGGRGGGGMSRGRKQGHGTYMRCVETLELLWVGGRLSKRGLD